MSSVLHITEPTFDFSRINDTSKLLSSINDKVGTECHTSLGDLTSKEIITISHNFDTINFVPNGFDLTSSIYNETVILLNVLQHTKSVTGYRFNNPNTFLSVDVDSRPTDPVLWVFGCSHSHGIGLKPTEKNFGQIISQELNLPLKQITKPGSSLNWSFRHLINANIKPTDLVIWQITVLHRISVFDGTTVNEVMLSQVKNKAMLEVYSEHQVFFNHLTKLAAGIRYLRSTGAQFLFLDITQNNQYFYDYLIEYSKYPEYCYQPFIRQDVGTDGVHVGPLSHKAIACDILSRV